MCFVFGLLAAHFLLVLYRMSVNDTLQFNSPRASNVNLSDMLSSLPRPRGVSSLSEYFTRPLATSGRSRVTCDFPLVMFVDNVFLLRGKHLLNICYQALRSRSAVTHWLRARLVSCGMAAWSYR